VLKSDDPPHREPTPVEAVLEHALPATHGRLALVARRTLAILPFVMLAAAVWVLWREFHHLQLDEVLKAMSAWGWGAIVASLALSIASFVLMGVIEWVGLRWTGAQVPWGPALAGSFLANAIAHSIGANLLVSGAIRARLYDRYGVRLSQVAATTLFAAMSFAVGLAALSGGGLLLAKSADLAATAIPVWVARTLGVALVVAAFGYVALCGLRRRPLTAFGRSMALPNARDAFAQLVIGVVDNGIAAAIIWILLPHATIGYPSFIGAYAVACVAGLVSSVPGGAGIFESALAALLPAVDSASLAAAFLGYRLAYYLLPLIIAALALAGDTLRQPRS
jgi:glycosyltransferase 2 family protein